MNDDDVKVLPSDVWLEILRRIPAADLLPLKAVCKDFHRLISDDFFTRLQLNYFTKNPKAKSAILTLTKYNYKSTHSAYYDPDERTISVWNNEPRFDDRFHSRQVIIDSYHGLLLVKIDYRVFLCNPITRSYKFFPSIRTDRLMTSMFWKIGYDDVSKQYKVFVLKRSESGNRVLFHVFDVHGAGEFRETTAMELGSQSKFFVKESILVNQNVYFLIITVEKSETLIGGTYIWRTHIVSANVTTEEVKIRSCSDTPYLDHYYCFFAANGTFYLVQPINSLSIDLRVLEGVESENPNPRWMIKQIIDLSNHVTSTIGYQLLGVFGTKVLIRIEIGEGREQLCQYDLISKEFEEVIVTSGCDNITHGMICSISSRIVEHTNSLISL